jgi:CheY-like chemotaxis protein
MMSLTSRNCLDSNFGGSCGRSVSRWNLHRPRDALARVASILDQPLILILSDINMPGMTGLEMLPKGQAIAA